MTSPAQIAANRANARHSTGPRTVEGKARSSRNRLTHGLCGPHTILPGEDPSEYEYLLNALLEEHEPSGPTETLLVAQLAQAQWKLNRIAAIEAELFAKQLLQNEPNSGELQATSNGPDLADAFDKAQKTLSALARHEAAARRAFDKALSNLWKSQNRRDDAKQTRDGYAAAGIDTHHPPALAYYDPAALDDHEAPPSIALYPVPAPAARDAYEAAANTADPTRPPHATDPDNSSPI